MFALVVTSIVSVAEQMIVRWNGEKEGWSRR